MATLDMIKRILIIGGGSAGFLAAITLKSKLRSLDITVIRSPEIGTIMVGEGTTDSVPNFLHGYLDITPRAFHEAVRPTYKAGIKFEWGPRDSFVYPFARQFDAQLDQLPRPHGYYCHDKFEFADLQGAMMHADRLFVRRPDGQPQITRNVGYHLDNRRLAEFLELAAKELGVTVIDGTIEQVNQDDHGITSVVTNSKQTYDADFYVDCSGFRSLLLGEAFKEPFVPYDSTLYCDRAVTGGWKRTDETIRPYSTFQTMKAGWSWRIEHEESINRGYVYSSAFISDDDAEAEFRKANPKIESTRLVPFASGRYERAWVKNVAAIGNSMGFLEPLESSAIPIICETCVHLLKSLYDGGMQVTASQRDYFNRNNAMMWDSVRRFLAIHYKFNTRLSNEFWNTCRNDINLAGAEEVIDYYKANGPSNLWGWMIVPPQDPYGWEGYLTLLVGQQVPYDNMYHPSDHERAIWNQACQGLRSTAANAFTVREVLDTIHSPQWGWNPSFYSPTGQW